MTTLADLYETRADHCADIGHDLPPDGPEADNVCRRCGEETGWGNAA